MTAQIKTITLRAKYESDLSGINDDVAKLKSIGRDLAKNNPFKIRPTLDLSGIRSDAQRAAREFNSAFKSAIGKGVTPGGSPSWGGLVIPASAAQSARQTASSIAEAHTKIAKENAELHRRLQDTVQLHKAERERLTAQEQAVQKIDSRHTRKRALEHISNRRSELQERSIREVRNIHQESQAKGLSPLEGIAKSHLGSIESTGIADMQRLTGATNKSGHVLNFHSISLLENAKSYARWSAAMTATTAPLAAVASGIQNAVQLERTFKTLNATFRGSKEDAQQLAQQTLMLAAANGRDGQEAAEAAIAWSRLGLTRSQALLATETSLRAANVAEISAAEATGFLTATYKSFHQSILDIPETLDYLNSLSNSNAEKTQNMFEALARGGAVAQEAGLSLKEYAGIVTAVGEATQRPGAEFGNASKTIFNRIRRPKTLKSLKEDFDLDFTTQSGGIQKMGDILAKLAAVYPTLSEGQQTYLIELIAGNQQSTRAITLLKTYTSSLIASSVASADQNSASRENAAILSSVDSGLQMVATSWNALTLSLAQGGAFDSASKFLQGLTDELNTLAEAANNASASGGKTTASPTFAVSDRTARLATSTARRGVHEVIPGMSLGDLTKPTEQELRDLLALVKAFPKEGTMSYAKKERYASSYSQFRKVEAMNSEKRSALKAELESALAGGASKTGASPPNPVLSVLDSERIIDGLSQGAKGLHQLSGDVLTKDPQQVLNDFDKSLGVFANLPGGGDKERLSAIEQIRPLLEKGEKTAASAAIQERAALLEAASKVESSQLEERRPGFIASAKEVLTKKRAEQAALERRKAGETGNLPAQKQITGEIEKLTDEIKSLQDGYDILTGKQKEAAAADPFAMQTENISDYIDQLKQAGEILGETFSGFGNTGFPGLDSKLKLGGALLGRNMLVQKRDALLAENEGSDPTSQAFSDRKKLADSLSEQISTLDELTPEIVSKNKLARQAAELNTSYTDARTLTGSGFARYEVGRSEGEKLSSRTFGALDELEKDIQNPMLGAGNATQDAAELGALSERLAQSKQGIFSMEERLTQNARERRQLEIDIADAANRRTDELSKQLSLASRGDQLQVAAAAKFLKNNGQKQFSQEEFQYFSQETRSALSRYSPGSVRGLDDSEQANAEARRKLNEEYNVISLNNQRARKRLNALLPQTEEKAGNLLKQDKSEGAGGPQNKSANNLSHEQYRMNLNTGPINISFDIASHLPALRDLLKDDIARQISEGLDSIRRGFTQSAGPNTSAAAGAF